MTHMIRFYLEKKKRICT